MVEALKGDSHSDEVVTTTNVDNDAYQIVIKKKSRWSSQKVTWMVHFSPSKWLIQSFGISNGLAKLFLLGGLKS